MKAPAINYAVSLLERGERQHILAELAAIKQQYAIRGQRVLELGCGLGANLALFADDNDVMGVDGLPDAVERVTRRGIRAVVADLEAQLPDLGRHDWILCLDVLEHLVHPLRLVHAAHRIAAPGGKLVVNVPNHFDLKGRLRLLAGSGMDVHRFFPAAHDWDNPHVRFFTYRGIRELLDAGGFRVIDDRSASHSSFAALERFPALRRRAVTFAPSLLAAGFFIIAQRV